jgi:hypothetical protein
MSKINALDLQAPVGPHVGRDLYMLVNRKLTQRATRQLNIFINREIPVCESDFTATDRLHVALDHELLHCAQAATGWLHLEVLRVQSATVPVAANHHFMANRQSLSPLRSC